MPYINPETAADIDAGGVQPSQAGELNYLLSRTIAAYVEANGLSYQTLNDAIGALTAAKDEFYRRIVVPYEDRKRRSGVDPYLHIRPVSRGGIAITEKPDDDWMTRVSGKN